MAQFPVTPALANKLRAPVLITSLLQPFMTSFIKNTLQSGVATPANSATSANEASGTDTYN